MVDVVPVGSVVFTLATAAAKPTTPPVDLAPALHSLVHFAVAVWPLWVLLALAAAAKLAFQVSDDRRLSRSGIRDVDGMDGRKFEEFLATRFRRLGYDAELTRYRGDYGADLVVTKSGIRTAVQAKRWSKTVGLKAVQEVVAAKAYYRCDRAIVVANRAFTREAQSLAAANDVVLWDRDILVAKLIAAGSEADPFEPDIYVSGHAVCEACGAPLSEKVRDYCLAHSQRFGGRLYCYAHQRRRPPEPQLTD